MKLIVASSTMVGPSVPAKRGSINKWKRLDDFISDADWLVERYDALAEQQNELVRYVKVTDRGEFDTAPDMTDPALDDDEIETLQKCHQAIALLDPGDNYDDEGNFKKSIIAKRLTATIGAIPSNAPPTPEVYIKMLVEHVAIIDKLNYFILECACREIERKQKYVPAIPEVLEIITEQQELWEKRQAAIGGIEERSRRIAEAIEKLKPKVKAALAERAEKEAVFALQFGRMRHETAKKIAAQHQAEAAEIAQKIELDFQRLAKEEELMARAEMRLAKAKRERIANDNTH
jgi:hypothetical protein